MASSVFDFTVVYASLTAMAGFTLAVVAWQSFRGSPFGRMMAGLAAILLVLSTYHGGLVIVDREAIPVLESVMLTLVLAWVGFVIRLHRRMSPTQGGS